MDGRLRGVRPTELAMARELRWWLAAALLACGAVAMAYLPPRGDFRPPVSAHPRRTTPSGLCGARLPVSRFERSDHLRGADPRLALDRHSARGQAAGEKPASRRLAPERPRAVCLLCCLRCPRQGSTTLVDQAGL